MTRVQRWWAVAAVLTAALFACTVGMAIAAFAAPAQQPTLVYDGASKSFSYRNVEGSDLFASFKDLVPGDERSQQFTVVAEHLDRPTTLYLRTDYDAAETAGLEAVELTVTADGTGVSDGAVGRDHRLDRDTKLVSLDRDGSFETDVAIRVPTSVGNELADSSHRLRWVFTAQEDGGDQAGGGAPNAPAEVAAQAASDTIVRTGDLTPPLALLAALAAATFALFALAARNARRP